MHNLVLLKVYTMAYLSKAVSFNHALRCGFCCGFLLAIQEHSRNRLEPKDHFGEAIMTWKQNGFPFSEATVSGMGTIQKVYIRGFRGLDISQPTPTTMQNLPYNNPSQPCEGFASIQDSSDGGLASQI